MGRSGNRKNRSFYSLINFHPQHLLGFVALIVFIGSCSNPTPPDTQPTVPPPSKVENKIPAPDFNADSAYAFVKQQVDFGPRVPGTKAHAKCADYLIGKLKSYGLVAQMQSGTVQTYDQKQFKLKNVIGSYKPELTERILLCSHWDTRPISEADTKDADKPSDGASDGASGVGVLLEVARALQAANPGIGVDIIFFDLEDYGENGGNAVESWCLGSQYWKDNLHVAGYTARFGILLDMVGAGNATFPKEANSVRFASGVVDKVWNIAANLGYAGTFLNETISFVGIDDHIEVEKAGVPCIDIIQYDKSIESFPAYHHTHQDNMSIIDKKTIKAVGQTLLEVIYNEPLKN